MAGGVSKATLPTMAGMVAALSGQFAAIYLTSTSKRHELELNDIIKREIQRNIMRRNAITSAVQEESDEINLTPMLDVVFIMLIFFIVTANFIKEPGLEINRPDSDTAETQENAAILIAVGPTGEVWMDGRRIDVRQVKANVVKLLADNPKGSVVIQADEKAMADTINL